MSFAEVRYAGAESASDSFSCETVAPFYLDSDAAILLTGLPDGQIVHDTTIADSAAHGILRGWEGDSIDYLTSNTFENVDGSKETYPRPSEGACPTSPPCP